MNLLLITLGSLALLALVAALVSKLTKGINDAVQPTHGDCSTCSGEDDRCEQVCYMEAATRDIEYYDDEELDQYKGRRPIVTTTTRYNSSPTCSSPYVPKTREDGHGASACARSTCPTRSRTTSLRSLKDEISQEKGNKTTRKRVY